MSPHDHPLSAEKARSPQPLLSGQLLQPPTILVAPCCTRSSLPKVFPVLGSQNGRHCPGQEHPSLERYQLGVSPPQVWGSAFVHDDFCHIPLGPFPQHIQVSVDGSPALHCVSCTPKLVSSAKVLSSQLSVTCPGPLLRMLNRMSPTAQPCSAPLCYSCCWPPVTVQRINHCPLCLTIQSIWLSTHPD